MAAASSFGDVCQYVNPRRAAARDRFLQQVAGIGKIASTDAHPVRKEIFGKSEQQVDPISAARNSNGWSPMRGKGVATPRASTISYTACSSDERSDLNVNKRQCPRPRMPLVPWSAKRHI